MRAKAIGIIFKKQIIELLRDKRAVFVIFILPILLYPLMIVGFAQMSIFLMGKMMKEQFPVAIENSHSAPELFALFEADTQLNIISPADIDSALEAGDILAHVIFAEGLEMRIAEGRSDSIIIRYDGSKERSDFVLSHISEIISGYEKDIVTARVTAAGLDSSVTEPINSRRENIASKEKMGGMVFGRILAMILVLMVISGAYYSSIDMIAGEKERGTLETLLVSPAGRMEIVFGKYLTVFVMAIVNALLNLASMGLTLSVGLGMMGGDIGQFLALSIAPATLTLILLQLLPLAALFSAIFLAVSSFAKSYKEAQSYLTPIFIVGQLFAMSAILPGLDINFGLAFVPVMNVSLLIKKLMVGPAGLVNFAVVWTSTAVFALLALRWAAGIISNEEALLSDSGGASLSRFFAHGKKPVSTAHAGAIDSIILFAIAVALLIWIGAPLQQKDIVLGLSVTEIALVALPALLFAKRMKLNIRKTFRFNKIELIPTLAIIPMAIAGFFLMTQLQVLTYKIIPFPTEYLDLFEGMLTQIAALGTFGGLLVLAALPGICEELLFRGYILDGLSRKWGAGAGVVVSGVLFGAFHLDPFRLIPTSILGILFGAIVLRRNSIYYGMLAHFINNACALLLMIYGGAFAERFFSEESFAPAWMIMTAGVVLVASLVVVLWKRTKKQNTFDVIAQ
ncbi:MAG TPA: CPBP family intramembrane metalloprotease [candidate division Zixibacteria bacterium]|nr:CPBP family intramembrane metalloprotease [candidate division Zixibacteria bacterium]